MPRRSSKLTAAEARLARQWPGLSRHRPLSSFPKRALEEGARVEAEHVGDYLPLARRIAADHLTEDPRYYEKIKRYGLAAGSAFPNGWTLAQAKKALLGQNVIGAAMYANEKEPTHGGHPYRIVGLTKDAVIISSYTTADAINERRKHSVQIATGREKSKFERDVVTAIHPLDHAVILHALGYPSPLVTEPIVVPEPSAAPDGHHPPLAALVRPKKSGLARGLAPSHKKGDPTRGNLQVLAHEIALHDARGDKTLHRFEAPSIPHLRRLIAAGYLAPAPGYPRGHWLVTGQAQMALLGI